ncbi:hypothetical protein [Streptomyces sp. NPDC059466]|uniref:hypothetical protein n=1 Tax=unclassified Streptomyces TaxID=2593676 RepID=UPI00368B714A
MLLYADISVTVACTAQSTVLAVALSSREGAFTPVVIGVEAVSSSPRACCMPPVRLLSENDSMSNRRHQAVSEQ